MEGILAALKELNTKGNVVEIIAPYTYVSYEINSGLIFKQVKNGFRKANGEPMANREMWRKIVQEILRTCKAIKVMSKTS